MRWFNIKVKEPKNTKVIVGLSGGVDSSVAALLLKQQGYDVEGLFMVNWDPIANFETNHKGDANHIGCESEKDFIDAEAIAKKIGIKIHRVNFVKEYWNDVFMHFINEYEKNRTPNPDILCNQYIKFNSFLDYAKQKFNADFIAMGHYAQVEHNKNSSSLIKAVDENKDQTYFLCNLSQNQLKNALFPIGHLTKKEVREIAKENGLITANKKDSTGICFIGERDFKFFLENYIPNKPGKIIDITNNQIVGEHIGTMYYTIGQRKGLNLGGMKERMFVCKKDIENKIIYVAPLSLEEDYLFSTQSTVENVNFIEPFDPYKPVEVRFRHRQPLIKLNNFKINNKDVVIDYPKSRAVTPGQYAVFYQGNKCIGGGVVAFSNVSSK